MSSKILVNQGKGNRLQPFLALGPSSSELSLTGWQKHNWPRYWAIVDIWVILQAQAAAIAPVISISSKLGQRL